MKRRIQITAHTLWIMWLAWRLSKRTNLTLEESIEVHLRLLEMKKQAMVSATVTQAITDQRIYDRN